jgi:hypothetical protein
MRPSIVSRRILLGVISGILVFSLPSISAPAEKFEFKGYTDLLGGYEGNFLRRPGVMDTGTGHFTEVIGDATLGGKAQMKSTFNPNPSNRIQLSISGDATVFPRYLEADEGQALADLDYRYRPVKFLSLKVTGGGGYVRKLAVDESSEGVAALYKYWQLAGGAKIEFSRSKVFSASLGYEFTDKDFEESDSGQSLDNRMHEVTASVVPRFGHGRKNAITIEASYAVKKYQELLSYDVNAMQLPTYPSRTYYYYTLLVGYKRDFGPVVWGIEERPRYRIDTFEDFYTYFENSVVSNLSISFSENTKLTLDGGWRYRDYAVHEAARPGPNPKLVMQYYDADAGFKQRLWKPVFFVAGYTLAMRTTNTGYLSFHTYRDYINHIANAGLRAEW